MCLGLPIHAKTLEYSVSGATYRIDSRHEDKLESLPPEVLSRFESKRELYLRRVLQVAHFSRPALISGAALGRSLWRLVGRRVSRVPIGEQVHRQIEGMVAHINHVLVDHAPLIADSSRDGVQVSIGGAGGIAAMNWGDSRGFWLNTHWDFPNAERGIRVRASFDREKLIWVAPFLFSFGLGFKVMFYIGFDSDEPDEGTAEYPAFLPHVILMEDTLAVGHSNGVFFPPAPYVAMIHEKINRSRSVSLTGPVQAMGVVVRSCASILSGLGRWVRRSAPISDESSEESSSHLPVRSGEP